MTEFRGPRDVMSQIGTCSAMRARDVSRPDDDDLARAEAAVVVSYRPPRPVAVAPDPAQESSTRGGNCPEVS